MFCHHGNKQALSWTLVNGWQTLEAGGRGSLEVVALRWTPPCPWLACDENNVDGNDDSDDDDEMMMMTC